MSPSSSPSQASLKGVRVVDFSQMLSGPFCTQQLADLGADIIKIEVPVRGDDSRHYTTISVAGEGALFLSANRNKRSIAVDLKSPSGLMIARALAATADVVVQNFSNGVADRLGIGYEALAADNPRLVYCSVTGYGLDDPSEVPRRAYDGMIQACSGFMSLTGYEDRPPVRSSIPILDVATALTATNAILAAIIARASTGRGQLVEIALLDVAMSTLTIFGQGNLISGQDLRPTGNRAPQTAPSDAYETADGLIFLTCGNNRLFERLAREALDLPELLTDPDFATNAARVKHIERLTEILASRFSQASRDHWVDKLNAAGVPVAPILSIGEAMRSDDVRRRGIVTEVSHPAAGQVSLIRSAMRLGDTPVEPAVAPPLLGQHTDEILREVLGMSADEVRTARSAGAFGPAPVL